MNKILIVAATVLLIVSKVPDFWTTWQGLKRSGDPNWEQNPIARWMFHSWGIGPSFVVLAAIYVGMVLGFHWFLWFSIEQTCTWVPVLSCDVIEHVSVWGYLLTAILIALIQWQVARYNQTGEMRQPLRWVYQRLQWFYR